MIRELVKDTEILSKPCEKATPEDAELAQDLVDTLLATEDASCIAANQIGVTKAVVVFLDDNGATHVLYNPRLLMGLRAGKAIETCLTLDEPVKVTRYDKIKVSFDELVDGAFKQCKRDYTGWYAQMIQHMIDHCQGKLV